MRKCRLWDLRIKRIEINQKSPPQWTVIQTMASSFLRQPRMMVPSASRWRFLIRKEGRGQRVWLVESRLMRILSCRIIIRRLIPSAITNKVIWPKTTRKPANTFVINFNPWNLIRQILRSCSCSLKISNSNSQTSSFNNSWEVVALCIKVVPSLRGLRIFRAIALLFLVVGFQPK